MFFSVSADILRVCAAIVYPPVCHSCNAPLSSGNAIVCRACRSAIVPVDEWDRAYREARSRLQEEGTVGEFVAAWYFESGGPLRALMHRMKYGGMSAIGEELGAVLGGRIIEAGLGGADLVVPLPLHRSRMRERGYNQCESIARGISSVTGLPVSTKILRRSRFTPSQTSRSLPARRENVLGAFAPCAGAAALVAGKNVLLVDDVVTTGSTMRSCAGALCSAGARSVAACALAIAR